MGRRSRPSDLAGSVRLDSPDEALDLLRIAANETLSLGNSAGRNRTLIQIALASIKVWEAVVLELRVRALESVDSAGWTPPGSTHGQ